MTPTSALVAYASRSGSTAGIAQVIAAVLEEAGIAVDSRPAGDVTDLTPYAAVVLGSGVFLPRRSSDGGGFLVRHAESLATKSVWLFCAGPIGRRCGSTGIPPEEAEDCSVGEVGRAVGARGCAVFGTSAPSTTDDPLARPATVDLGSVRAWAREIAAAIVAAPGPAAAAMPSATSPRGRRRVHCHGAAASG